MLLRVFIFFLLFYLFYRIYFSGRRTVPPAAKRDDITGAAEEMVLDPQCKSYLPKSEAMLRGGEYFCSERCASLYLVGRSS
jgi:hypothetical protein